MPSPLISQGTLNRLRGSVTWASNSALNVTAPYLGKSGIRLSLQGDSVTYIPTLTGAVTSPEPFMMIEMVMSLLKTQALADAYKSQLETNSLMGDATVRTDAATLSVYQLVNCSIRSIRELDFSGEDATFAVTIGGYYLVNANLFS